MICFHQKPVYLPNVSDFIEMHSSCITRRRKAPPSKAERGAKMQ